MNNTQGAVVLFVWFLLCAWFAVSTRRILTGFVVGFIVSWAGLVVVGIFVEAYYSSIGMKAVQGAMAFLFGWIPCLLVSGVLSILRWAGEEPKKSKKE